MRFSTCSSWPALLTHPTVHFWRSLVDCHLVWIVDQAARQYLLAQSRHHCWVDLPLIGLVLGLIIVRAKSRSYTEGVWRN